MMLADAGKALKDILGTAVTLNHANGAGRALELYIMTGLARELKVRGASVHLLKSDGKIIGPHDTKRKFVQRGGAPTGISGASAGPNNATAILFSLPHSRRQWEIWNGIQFIGRSGGTHEVDIAVVPHSVGIALRSLAGGGTPGGRPMVSIECKDVGGGKRPTVASPDDMRAFLARMYDLTMLEPHDGKISYLPFPLTKIFPGAPLSGLHGTYRSANLETLNVVAHRTGFGAGATAMTQYYAVRARPGIRHGTAEYSDLITEIRDWIEAKLR